MIVVVCCKECEGKGSWRKIGPYEIVCRRCGGDGLMVTDYFTVVDGEEVL